MTFVMKKIIIVSLFAFIALSCLFIYQYLTFHDGKLHVVFCDVGQGDGILITTPSNKQILVDAGPDKRILDCLGKHMPFWDRTIDIALLTHPHADHFAGYYYIVDQYRIDHFATEALRNNTDGFAELEKRLQREHIKVQHVSVGDRWTAPVIASDQRERGNLTAKEIASSSFDKIRTPRNDVIIEVLGPTNTFLVSKDPDGIITNSAESASLVIKVSYGEFSVLLTGDAPIDEMTEIALDGVSGLDVLQIPHHGSTTGIDEEVLSLLQPRMAVISVGKNNYGHPKKEVLELLQKQGITILRTDERGDVAFVSNGKEITMQE